MSQINRELPRLLNAPRPPATLKDQLRANLEAQAHSGRRPLAGVRLALGAAVVASILVGLAWFVYPWIKADGPVAAAVTHFQHEANLTGPMDGGYQAWLDRLRIQPPPPYLVATFSKDCVISATLVKHVRFRSPTGGVLRLFIHAGDARWLADVNREGRIGEYHWFVIQAGPRVSALLFYDQLVTPDQVRDLAQTMFSRPRQFSDVSDGV